MPPPSRSSHLFSHPILDIKHRNHGQQSPIVSEPSHSGSTPTPDTGLVTISLENGQQISIPSTILQAARNGNSPVQPTIDPAEPSGHATPSIPKSKAPTKKGSRKNSRPAAEPAEVVNIDDDDDNQDGSRAGWTDE